MHESSCDCVLLCVSRSRLYDAHSRRDCMMNVCASRRDNVCALD